MQSSNIRRIKIRLCHPRHIYMMSKPILCKHFIHLCQTMIISESRCLHLHPRIFLEYISKSFHQIFKMLHIPGSICTHLGIPKNYLFHGHFSFPLVPADIFRIPAIFCWHYGKSKFITIFICNRLEMIFPIVFR